MTLYEFLIFDAIKSDVVRSVVDHFSHIEVEWRRRVGPPIAKRWMRLPRVDDPIRIGKRDYVIREINLEMPALLVMDPILLWQDERFRRMWFT